ncbi:MAG: DNA primase [Patescibacteria group bacterium]|nr:DNA primase [Patescibacteria group bacterium]
MSSDIAQQVKEKLDIVEFLRNYIELKPAGKNFKALCPFHKEKTPSFMVSPERQTWHCFGTCGEGGDIIKFLMKYENIEFYDALKILADKAGIEMRPGGDRDFQASQKSYRILESAKDFFVSQLGMASKVNEYLAERGLKPETVKEFEIGVAPDGSDQLMKHLIKQGFPVADIEQVGLAIKTDRGMYRDRFRARIMFPIHNHTGKVVGFTGRIMPGSENEHVGNPSTSSGFVAPKYVNSPESPVFQKSRILYGFHKTKGDIRDAHVAVIVEGQMDLIMAWQDGVKNIVATSGTALTNDHLTMLRRVADELVLSFDADEAGQAAAERAIDMANAHDFTVKLLVIDDAKLKDPADVARKQPGHLAELVKSAKPAMEYYFQKYMEKVSDDLKLKKQAIRLILAKIRGLSSPIDRSYWIRELSYRVKMNEDVLVDEMTAISAAPAPAAAAAPKAALPADREATRRDIILRRLLGIMLHLKSDLQMLNDYVQYFPPAYADVYRDFTRPDDLRRKDIEDLMSAISMKFSFENQDMDVESLEKEIGVLLRRLKITYLEDRRKELSESIRTLERSGDDQKLQQAMQEFAAVSRELQGA